MLPIEEVINKALVPVAKPDYAELAKQGVMVIDTRNSVDFMSGLIPGSLNLPLTMNYAIWAGTLFSPTTKFFLVTDPGKEKESIIRLARIGYDNIVGYLDGGVDTHRKYGSPTQTIGHVPVTAVT